jgi:hypothetical protein
MKSFDAFDKGIVFCIWFGQTLPINRAAALLSIIDNINVPIQLINNHNYKRWELVDAPFHPAFDFLTDTHKSDYLRTYLMLHFGGGYHDIKFSLNDWEGSFRDLAASEKQFAGYPVASPTGICLSLFEKYNPQIVGQIRAMHDHFPGTSAFIFKKHTAVAKDLLNAMHDILDNKIEQLKSHPGRFAQEYRGAILEDGSISKYPLGWTELLGDNFHSLIILKYMHSFILKEIKPSSEKYRKWK